MNELLAVLGILLAGAVLDGVVSYIAWRMQLRLVRSYRRDARASRESERFRGTPEDLDPC